MKSPEWRHFIENLARSHNAVVEPVYILSPDGLNWRGDFSGPWVKRYEPLAREAAWQTLEKFNPELISPLRILVNQKVSLRGDVAKLNQYAARKKASFVLVKTQARHGLERWVLGSFAESLMLQAKVPMVAINPHTRPPNGLQHLLFPTDLSAASKRAFLKVVEICRKWNAALVLAHKLPDPLEPIVQSGVYMAGGGWITLADYFEKEASQRRAQLVEWQDIAERKGVKTSVRIIDEPGAVPASIIAAAAQEQSEMISLSSQASRTSSVLVGSVARQLLRSAPSPLMIFHGA